ncbi:MAG TPA: response regulator transcription factor [Streptosporangiaceae bacterium]|nr:response regulator transcription factor [Streptosporangiaceae bacterium]
MHRDEHDRAQSRHADPMNPIRLILADDHFMITEALASRLAAPDIWVAARCAASDPNLLAIVKGVRPDVIAIDSESYAAGVGDLVERLTAHSPQAHVVILSGDRNAAHAVAAARAGAAAWVAKEQDADEFESVVRGVCRGYSWYPPEMLGEILRSMRTSASRGGSDLHVLSSREIDVLRAMMTGSRGRQIAADLHISADTVRTHTQNIYAKLDVHSRLEAVSVARAAGLEPRDRAVGS